MNELLEANKRTIQDYAELAFNRRKPEEAVAKYQGPYYRQHNPGAADGPEPFIRMVGWFAQTYPSFRLELKRILADGDLVVRRQRRAGPGSAVGESQRGARNHRRGQMAGAQRAGQPDLNPRA